MWYTQAVHRTGHGNGYSPATGLHLQNACLWQVIYNPAAILSDKPATGMLHVGY